MRLPEVRLRFREELLGRDALYLPHAVVVGLRRVYEYERPADEGMVAASRRHVLARSRYGTYGFLRVRSDPLVRVRVALQFARIASVGIRYPAVMRLVVAAVDIVPAHVDHPPVVVHARLEFVRLVRRDADDVGSVRKHRMKRVCGYLALVAPAVSATAFRAEYDTPVGKPAWEQVVHGARGQLFEPGTVGMALEDMEHSPVVPFAYAGLALRTGEKYLFAVPAHVGRKKSARSLGVAGFRKHKPPPGPRSFLDLAVHEDAFRDALSLGGKGLVYDVKPVAARHPLV